MEAGADHPLGPGPVHSNWPDFGYKIQRLAKDVQEFLTGLELSNVALLGHTMGCSVIWCYWDLFGRTVSLGEGLLKLLGQLRFLPEPAEDQGGAAGLVPLGAESLNPQPLVLAVPGQPGHELLQHPLGLFLYGYVVCGLTPGVACTRMLGPLPRYAALQRERSAKSSPSSPAYLFGIFQIK